MEVVVVEIVVANFVVVDFVVEVVVVELDVEKFVVISACVFVISLVCIGVVIFPGVGVVITRAVCEFWITRSFLCTNENNGIRGFLKIGFRVVSSGWWVVRVVVNSSVVKSVVDGPDEVVRSVVIGIISI